MSEPTAHHDEEVLGKAYDARLMRRLLGYIRPYRGMTVTALALILASSLFQLVGPLATAVALDLFIRPQGSGGQLSAPSVFVRGLLLARGIDPARIAVPGLTVTSLVYLAALVLTFAALYAQGYVLQLMGQYIMNDLRRQIFGHLQRLPLGFYDRNPIGRLVTRVTTDVDALNEMFTAGIVTIFGDVLVLAGIAGVLFWLDWRLALVSFSIVPLLLLLTSWFKGKVRESFREVRVKIARINAFLQEHVTGMAVVQLFNREARAYSEFEEINAAHRDANVRSIFYYAIFFPGVELITSLGAGLLIWVGGGRVLASALSIGGLIAFLQYAQRFYQPLSDLSEKYNILQSAMASSERIFRLVDTPATIATPPQAYSPERVRGEIEFDDVWFSYKEDEPVLKGVSFRVRPGETLAVVGHTGAGKSTLANLLLRFYDVDRGAVRAAGAGLTVGQKQLIAFARALAFDPSILFLDEATSSIDTETEQLIQRALDRLLVGRTSVVIAHRLSTIQKADRILVLHKGEVREYGTHQELLALRGIYYRLYLLQYKDQEGAEMSAAVRF